ncbi:MAG: DNA-binding response regulator [Planctomycetota bacterium]|nr:MAG: DNA-binding response regulator [Planctomycetota bacterium]
MKILIAEDDLNIRTGIKAFLEDESYDVVEAANGVEAVEQFNNSVPDMVLLDIMMPLKNGYDVCKEIRENDKIVPIIFLSAKSEEIDKVLGLELGADDYVMKPFGIQELLARIRAVYRRFEKSSSDDVGFFMMNHLKIIPSEYKAYFGDTFSELSKRELLLLQKLFGEAGKVVSRNEMMNAGWGVNHFPNSRTLDQLISQLRKRIEIDNTSPKIIQTVHGRGFRFSKD